MKPVDPKILLGKDIYTDLEIRGARLDICNSCDKLTDDRLCVACYCYVDIKTNNLNSYCPLRKW